MTIAIRLALSIALLWQVWLHAHWSVALALTLILTRIELVNVEMRMRVGEPDAGN